MQTDWLLVARLELQVLWVVRAPRGRLVEICLASQGPSRAEVAADSTPPLLQVQCGSEWVLDKSSDDITIGSGVQRYYHGRKHRYAQQGYGEESAYWFSFCSWSLLHPPIVHQSVDPVYQAMTGHAVESQQSTSREIRR